MALIQFWQEFVMLGQCLQTMVLSLAGSFPINDQ